VRTCAYGNLAFMAGQGGRLAEALALQERAMAQMAQASVFPDHLRAANTARMALFKGEAGQGSEADRLFQQALDLMTAGGRERSLAAWTVRNEWSVALSAAGNARQALQQVEDNLRLADTDGGFTPQLLYVHRSLGLMQLTLGRFAQAQETFESSLEKAAAGGGETAEMVRAITCDKALVATRSGRLDTAAQALAQADKVPRRASASDAFYDRGCRMVRAEFDIARGAADQGLAAVQAVLAGPGGQSPVLQGSARVLATKAHLALAQPAAAVAQAEQALALARKLQSDRPHSYRTGTAGMWLGAAQAAAGQREQARATLAQAIEQLQGSVDDQHPWLEEMRLKLAALGPAAGATR
jgi:tetratricopeptide (TPR) repeat protein